MSSGGSRGSASLFGNYSFFKAMEQAKETAYKGMAPPGALRNRSGRVTIPIPQLLDVPPVREQQSPATIDDQSLVKQSAKLEDEEF